MTPRQVSNEVRRCQRALDKGSPRDFWIKRLTEARKRLNASAAILSMQLAVMEQPTKGSIEP